MVFVALHAWEGHDVLIRQLGFEEQFLFDGSTCKVHIVHGVLNGERAVAQDEVMSTFLMLHKTVRFPRDGHIFKGFPCPFVHSK